MTYQVRSGCLGAYRGGAWETRTEPAADGTTALYIRHAGQDAAVSSGRPELSFSTDATGLEARLRVDEIRRRTIVGLVAEWGEGGREDTIEALDALAEAVSSHDSWSDEIAALADAVEDTTGMGYAQVRVSDADLLRLRQELDRVIRARMRLDPSRDDGGDVRVTALLDGRRQGRDAA
jgi:hypothetical protein